ncbi:Putative nucleotide-binding protein with TIR-like domain [Hyphomicrobiales bacterium]|nr:Putative nucleotide-binding protein with TIR-like domain [Hyphomicrobiales bacterium]CAH1693053.1 putative nucleotide-binding protein with TIR-like domain [Hyphomicrobiales bacterium]
MNDPGVLEQMTEALFELQGARIRGFHRPIKKLSNPIHHPDLEPTTKALSEKVDFDAFIKKSRDARTGSHIADGRLDWPDDDAEQLGLFIKIVDKLSESERYTIEFAREFFYSSSGDQMSHIYSMTSDLMIPFVKDYQRYVVRNGQPVRGLVLPGSNKVFVVNGHDEGARESVARFIDKLGLEAVILAEQVDQGRTVIQKFEDNASEVGFAVVLITPDDIGGSVSNDEQSRRARQNVLFELGYFRGCLGKGKVCLVRKGDVEIPSDLAGVLYTEMDMGGGWKTKLAKEIDAAGLPIKSDWFRG